MRIRHRRAWRGNRRVISWGVGTLVLGLALASASVAVARTSAKAPLPYPKTAKTCGTSDIKMAFVSPLGNTYGQAIEKGIRQYLKPCKNVSISNFDTGFDSQKQFNVIQDITTQKTFKAILFLPLDGVGVVPAVEGAIKAGIQVVNFNNPLGNDFTTARVHIRGQAGTVIEPQYQRGIWEAQIAALACKGDNNCKIGYIAGVIGISAELAIKLGFDKELKKHSNMHLTTYQGGGQYLPDPSRTVAQNMLQAHRDLDVIVASGDQMIRGAEIAVADANRQKQVKLIGLGGSQIGVAAVKAGRWFGTVITQPLDQGRLTGKIALDHVLNPKLPSQGVNPFTYTRRSPLLTKETLAKSKFVPQWSG